MIAAFCLVAGCSGGQQETETVAAEAGQEEPAAYSSIAGTEVTTGDGVSATVISVGVFDANTNLFAGRIAVEGRVEESFPDRNTFVLVDCSTDAGCTKACCPQAKVPVRLDAGAYDGRLPRQGESVVVIGDLTVTDTGYHFDVMEARSGAETLLTTTQTRI